MKVFCEERNNFDYIKLISNYLVWEKIDNFNLSHYILQVLNNGLSIGDIQSKLSFVIKSYWKFWVSEI